MRRIYPFLFFALTVVLIFWKPIFHKDFTFLNGGDMAAQAFPWFNAAAYWLKKGVLLIWDPYVYSGRSFLGELQPGILYPLNWIFLLIPAKGGGINLSALQCLLFLDHILAAYFCYLLARSLGMNFISAALAGVGFSTGGYSGQISTWPHILGAFIWVPLIIWAFRNAFFADERKPQIKWLSWAAMFMALSFLAGHAAGVVHAGFFLVIWTAYILLSRWKATSRRKKTEAVVLLVLLAVTSTCLVAAQLIPSAEWASNVLRWIGAPSPLRGMERIPFSFLEQPSSLGASSAVALVLPFVNSSEYIYTGLPIVFLALVGFLFARKRESVFFGAMAFLYFFVTWARSSALHGWIYTFVPGIWFAREHYLFAALLQLCLSILAGYGLDYLSEAYAAQPERAASIFIKRAGWSLGALVLCAGVFITAACVFRNMALDDTFLLRIGALATYASALGILLFMLHQGRIKPTSFAAAVLVLIVVDISSSISAACPRTSDPQSVVRRWTLPPAGEYLKAMRRQDIFRVEDPTGVFPDNFGDGWLLEGTMGHGATALTDYMDFRSTDWAPASNASELLNTTYVVGNLPLDGMKKVFEQDGIAVYRNPRAVPRAFLASSFRSFSSGREMLTWINSPLFSPKRTVALSEEQLRSMPSYFSAVADERGPFVISAISYKTAGEKQSDLAKDPQARKTLRLAHAPWGWTSGDEISFSIRSDDPVQAYYLNIEYQPTSPSPSVISVHVAGAGVDSSVPVILQGLTPGSPNPSQPLHMAANLGRLGKDEYRVSLQKTDQCSATIDELRISAAPVLESPDAGTAAITSFAPGFLRVHAELKQAAFLVVSEVYYPGWEALVDGQTAPLLKGDYVLQTVPLTPGAHEIELRFRSKPFLAGLLISLMSLAAVAYAAVRCRSVGAPPTAGDQRSP